MLRWILLKVSRTRFWNPFVTWLGDILVFPSLMGVWIDSKGHDVKGEHTREVLDLIRPGDLLVRKFDHYLDGWFIPGHFSHVAIYLGEVGSDDLARIEEYAARVKKGRTRRNSFKTGREMVIHAVAEGVIVENLITFCRCDELAVLRIPDCIRATAAAAPLLVDRDAVYMDPTELAILCELDAGREVPFAHAWATIRKVALGKLGTKYDFNFEFEKIDRMSCCEFVYFALKSLAPFHRVAARSEGWQSAGLPVITPDAFASAPFEPVYLSPRVARKNVLGLAERQGSRTDPCRAAPAHMSAPDLDSPHVA